MSFFIAGMMGVFGQTSLDREWGTFCLSPHSIFKPSGLLCAAFAFVAGFMFYSCLFIPTVL